MADGNPLILGQNNRSNAGTYLRRGGTNPDTAFFVRNRSGAGVAAYSDSSGAVYGDSTGETGVTGHGTDGLGVFGHNEGPSAGFAGVYGVSTNGSGVAGRSTNDHGVSGRSDKLAGVFGLSPVDTGVYGVTNGGFAGVAGASVDGGIWAGSFKGPVRVTGRLEKAGGGFKIDHPLDPANRYLNHSFVESPEMKCVYDGVAELGEDGSAWVQLPAWFEALNTDYRYQLTSIGGSAPQLHVAAEVSGNRFRIAGGEAGAKISWQVTGVRQDAWAKAHPIEVEENKPVEDQGKYLHPEEHRVAEERGVGWQRLEELRLRTEWPVEQPRGRPDVDEEFSEES
jgi:hypothetical protein